MLLDFLHPSIKDGCLESYKADAYTRCTKEAFSLVRSVYRNKFNSENVPNDFLKSYHVTKTLGDIGSQEDKNFQIGCEHIFRSINKFRNTIEHGDAKISKEDAEHYLYLASMALGFLDTLKLYPNNTHPLGRTDYQSEKDKGTINFNYSNNNGRYEIGKGPHSFTIKVSSRGDNSLHLYNDFIKGVGLIDNGDDARKTPLENIKTENLKNVDMSSGNRVIDLNNTAVLLNHQNRYGLLRLESATRHPSCEAKIRFHICKESPK